MRGTFEIMNQDDISTVLASVRFRETGELFPLAFHDIMLT
jgi:hypothetical protein